MKDILAKFLLLPESTQVARLEDARHNGKKLDETAYELRNISRELEVVAEERLMMFKEFKQTKRSLWFLYYDAVTMGFIVREKSEDGDYMVCWFNGIGQAYIAREDTLEEAKERLMREV